MNKEFPLTVKILSFLLMAYSFTLGTAAYAYNLEQNVKIENIHTQKSLRFIDTKKEYGKSCEAYSYITPLERFKLLKQDDYMFGDILSDSLSISSVDPEFIVENNMTECRATGTDSSEYTYEEKLRYINDDMVTIEVFQYSYGAGAAHGNGHRSLYMYDRHYGMKIDWQTLFGSSEVFDLYVLKRVLDEIASEDFLTTFKTNKLLLNFRKQGYFAITDKGLQIQYGKYEIAPGASGLPSLLVPKEILKQYMTKEMYMKCFFTQQQIMFEVMNAF